jgi:V/A-type H+-transporting ATPase subunit E
MSYETGQGSEDEIINKILGDGKARADRVLDNARRSADSENRKAEAEAERIRKEMLDQVARKARVLESKEIAGAHIEAKRILLRAREEAIERVFKMIREDLDKLHDDTSRYRQALVGLAAEAVRAIGEPEVVLAVGEEDGDLVESGLAKEIENSLASEGSDEVRIEMIVDPKVSGGGCVARSKDARVIFDNTFSRRLEREKPALRSTIVSEVLTRDA